jgi:hypothetical protein
VFKCSQTPLCATCSHNTFYSDKKVNILAWEERPNADKEERARRQAFKGERTNAASAVQSLARVVKAKREIEYRRRKQHTQMRLGEEERVEQEKARSRILRPAGKSWC